MKSCLLIVFFALLNSFATAQVDTIRANPNVVQLREIWHVRGDISGGDYVGAAAGGIGDVSGDSINDLAVYVANYGEWRFYYGGNPTPSTTPALVIKGTPETYTLVVGDFWGTGHWAFRLPMTPS